MTQPLPTRPAAVLDVFEGTRHIIRELETTLSSARSTVMNNMAAARMDRCLDGMSEAHIELDKLLGQSRLLSESLGRVIQFHVNRRKAQS